MPRMHRRAPSELSLEELEHEVEYCQAMEYAGFHKKARQGWKKAKEDAQAELNKRKGPDRTR